MEYQPRLKQFRKSRKITQTELSRLSGYSRQWINRVEKGRNNPSNRFKKHISSILLSTVKEVFGE